MNVCLLVVTESFLFLEKDVMQPGFDPKLRNCVKTHSFERILSFSAKTRQTI